MALFKIIRHCKNVACAVELNQLLINLIKIMKSSYSFFSILFLILSFFGVSFLFANPALAHGGGESLEKVVNAYKIDIGYDSVTIEAAKPLFFDFDLVFNESGEGSEFSDIWVRIAKGKQTVFAGGIHKPSFGNTTMVYTFSEGGEYDLNVRFQNEGEEIVEASFPLAVQSASNAADSGLGISFLWLAIGAAMGVTGGFFTAFALNIGKKKNGNVQA